MIWNNLKKILIKKHLFINQVTLNKEKLNRKLRNQNKKVLYKSKKKKGK